VPVVWVARTVEVELFVLLCAASAAVIAGVATTELNSIASSRTVQRVGDRSIGTSFGLASGKSIGILAENLYHAST
jgi:peptidoglycan/LPS O-acetylase OafA/YrhL